MNQHLPTHRPVCYVSDDLAKKWVALDSRVGSVIGFHQGYLYAVARNQIAIIKWDNFILTYFLVHLKMTSVLLFKCLIVPILLKNIWEHWTSENFSSFFLSVQLSSCAQCHMYRTWLKTLYQSDVSLIIFLEKSSSYPFRFDEAKDEWFLLTERRKKQIESLFSKREFKDFTDVETLRDDKIKPEHIHKASWGELGATDNYLHFRASKHDQWEERVKWRLV